VIVTRRPQDFARTAILVSLVLFLGTPAASQQFDSSLYSGMRWRLIGPFRGGRALTAVGVPGQPNVFYFGAVGGGIWKSTDAGTVWEPIFDAEPIASIGAIAVAPSNPNIIYAGTGEADMRSDITYGSGVYRSTDAGRTWAFIGLKDTRQIGRILVDPHNPDVAFVAALGHSYGPNAERGVFRSKDGGATWERVLFRDENTGAIDLAFDPQNSQIIYAALWQTRRPPWNVYAPSNGPGSGLYTSTDGGATWQHLTGNGLPSEGLGRIGIAVAPSDPKRVYLIVDAKEGGLYRSDDAGHTWKRTDSEQRIWGRGWYFGGIAVDPRNADILYVANTSTYRSTDGGHSFTAIKGAPGGDDYHSVWIAPDDSQRIILSSDQGSIVSLNSGKTWSSWYNQPTGQFYHVSTDREFPYWVYGAQQDSGAMAVRSRSNSGELTERDWHPIEVGDENGYIAPDPADPNILFGGTVSRYDRATAQNRAIAPTLGRIGPFRSEWTLPLTFSAANPRQLYFGAQFLFRTENGGESWDAISPDLTREDPGTPGNLDTVTAQEIETNGRRGVIYAIAPSPFEAGLIWIGTDDGYIQLTRDAGKQWENVTPNELTPWSKVGIIEASRFDANTAYAAVDRHRLDDLVAYIYRTHDAGKTWQRVNNGIPEGAFVNVVREDIERKGLLYAGTELGIYVSFNGGDNWQPLQLNLPVASIRDIAVHDDDLVVATHGRAFWILDDLTPLRQLDARVAAADAYLFKPAAAWRVHPHGFQGTPLPPETPKAENPPAGAILDYHLRVAPDGPITLEILDASGNLVHRYSSDDKPPKIDPKTVDIPEYWIHPAEPLSAKPGMHRFVWDLGYAAPPQLGPASHFFGAAGAFALPGQYTVKLTVAGHAYTQPLVVKMDPRVKTPAADLAKQFETATAIGKSLAQISTAYHDVQGVRTQLKDLRVKSSNDSALVSKLDEIDRKAEVIIGAPPSLSDLFGPADFDPKRTSLQDLNREFAALQRAVESADAAPTREAFTAFDEYTEILKTALARWDELKTKDIPQLNELVHRSNLPAISLSPDSAPSKPLNR
jgi:photosystem II stability/assembly factor-like uncharacterized protein